MPRINNVVLNPTIVQNESLDDYDSLEVVDPCAICLGPLVESACVKGCGHIFCYSCIRKWMQRKNLCPFCQSPISYIVQYSGETKEPQVKPLNVIHKEIQAEVSRDRCNKMPLDTEKDIITRRMDELEKDLEDLRKDIGSFNDRNNYKEIVTERTILRSLMQQISGKSLTRNELVSNLYFRRLIYKLDTEWYEVERDVNPFRITFNFGNKMSKETRLRLLSWIENELVVLKVSNYKEVAKSLLDICNENCVYSTMFQNYLKSLDFSKQSIEYFQRELSDFANSQLAMNDYWNICGYRMYDGVIPHVGDFSISRSTDIIIPLIELDDDDEDNDLDDIEGEVEEISSDSDGESSLYMRQACLLRIPKRKHESNHVDPEGLETIPNFASTSSESGNNSASILGLFSGCDQELDVRTDMPTSESARGTSIKRRNLTKYP